MAWTAEQHQIHADMMERKANGFYNHAAKLSLVGKHAKADRMFGRGIECGVSAHRHRQRAMAMA